MCKSSDFFTQSPCRAPSGHRVLARMPSTDATDALRDLSTEDLQDSLPSIHWQLKRALQLLDNSTPDAVDYLMGELEQGRRHLPTCED